MLSLHLNGCSTNIKQLDKPVCVELNMSKAFCTNLISSKDFYIDEENKFEGKTWFEMRPAMILVPPSSWEAFKVYIIQTCKRAKCDNVVESWDRTIETVDKKIKEKSK